MSSVVNNAQVAAATGVAKPIDLGFRWYEMQYFVENLMLMVVSRIDGTFSLHLSQGPTPDHTSDVSIEFTNALPEPRMQLKITADIKEQKYEVRRDGDRTIHWVSRGRM